MEQTIDKIYSDVNQHIIMVNLENNTDKDQDMVLFGSNRYGGIDNKGNPEGTHVANAQTDQTYSQILSRISEHPIQSSLIRLQSENLSQLKEVIALVSKEGDDDMFKMIHVDLKPESFHIYSCTEFGANLLDSAVPIAFVVDIPVPIVFDANSFWNMKVRARTKVSVTIFPMKEVPNTTSMENLKQYHPTIVNLSLK